MRYLFLALSGIVGGVLGGMGMGGGTLLIPALTIFFKLEQRLSQTINLVAFVPMAIVALIIHIKNKMIKNDGLPLIIISAFVTAICGSFLAKLISGNLQTKLFGAFLCVLAIIQFIVITKQRETTNE